MDDTIAAFLTLLIVSPSLVVLLIIMVQQIGRIAAWGRVRLRTPGTIGSAARRGENRVKAEPRPNKKNCLTVPRFPKIPSYSGCMAPRGPRSERVAS